MNPDDVFAKARELRAAGVPLAEIEKYIQSKLGTPAPEPEPGIGTKALGVAASLVRDIPGMEAAQAGVRSLVRRQPYREALSDIRGAEEAAPKALTIPARIAGAIPAALALPGGMITQGASYGALSGALNADPDADMGQRGTDATVGALGGAALGASAGAASGLLRVVRNAPKGAVGKAAGEFLPSNVKRGARAVRALTEPPPTAVKPQVRLHEASAPKAEGFVGNSMDNVLEAVRAQQSGGGAAGDAVVEAVKKAKYAPTRHRTQAQFDYFADRMAKRAAAEDPNDLSGLLRQSLELAKDTGKLPVPPNPFLP